MDTNRYFDCIDICKVHSHWSEVRVTGTLPSLADRRALTPTLITVLEPTEVEFTLFQEGHRYGTETWVCAQSFMVMKSYCSYKEPDVGGIWFSAFSSQILLPYYSLHFQH